MQAKIVIVLILLNVCLNLLIINRHNHAIIYPPSGLLVIDIGMFILLLTGAPTGSPIIF